MFAEYICNVLIAWNMTELNQTCGNSFTYTMIGEGDMLLGKARVRDCGTLYDRCVFSKQVCGGVQLVHLDTGIVTGCL